MNEGTDSGYSEVTEEIPEEPAEEPGAVSDRAIRWERLIRSLLGIRRIQRLFAYTGHYLQNYPRNLLRRLTDSYPQQR